MLQFTEHNSTAMGLPWLVSGMVSQKAEHLKRSFVINFIERQVNIMHSTWRLP
jgi:hypothetical protein